MSASSNRLFVWDVYSGPHGAMLVLPSGEIPTDEGWEVHTLGVSSEEAWKLTAPCRQISRAGYRYEITKSKIRLLTRA